MAEYTLMNKNHPVVSFRYDRDIHAVVKIVDVHDLRYAPVALADSKGIVTRRALNDWWRRRAIPASRQSEMEEHFAEQDWLKISHEIPQELRDVTDRFIRAVRVHACNQVDTAYLAGMRDMMKIAAAFGLYEIDPDDVLPTRQRK